jgi:Cys-tRNA synthase (O-phospho-L-seryl-tRNA:Cys-tRNA synthase)
MKVKNFLKKRARKFLKVNYLQVIGILKRHARRLEIIMQNTIKQKKVKKL